MPLLYLSAYFERHRNDYYDLLLAVSERGAWHDWAGFFLNGAADQARDANTRAKQLQDLQLKWRQQLQAMPRTSALLLQLVDELFQKPAIIIPQVQKMLKVRHLAANEMVKRLMRESILEPIPGKMRHRQFFGQEIFAIMGEDKP